MPVRLLGVSLALVGLWVAGTVAAKPGTVTPVPLIVDVEDTVGLRITGDGVVTVTEEEVTWTRYEDGVDGVAASIDQYGNLIVNFQVVRSAPTRKLHYDYGVPLDGQTTTPTTADPPNNYISTQRHDGDPLKIQDIGVGESGCYLAGVYYTLEDAKRTQYWHSFGRAVTGMDVSATARLKVTRTSPDTWEVTSENDCNAPHSGTALVFRTPTVGKFSYTSEGHFTMPLRMILTRK